MKLLTETISELVSESKVDDSGKKHYYLEGVVTIADQKNLNGRIYPLKAMKRAIDAYQSKIKSKTSIGELQHPKGPEAGTINLANISHIFEKVWQDETDPCKFYTRARILDTAVGKEVQALIEGGVALGFSTRAMGSVIYDEDRKANIVQDDLNIITLADIVQNPSCASALPNAIFESAEYEYDPLTGNYTMITSEEVKPEVKEDEEVITEKKPKECCGKCKEGEECACEKEEQAVEESAKECCKCAEGEKCDNPERECNKEEEEKKEKIEESAVVVSEEEILAAQIREFKSLFE